jgi:hypothetical protein
MKRVLLALPLLILGGCVISARPAVVEVSAPVVAVEAPVVDVEPVAPVIEGPGVEVIAVEPAIEVRQYVYDPGFPPGVYLVGGFYYYGGHRYAHDVFINRVVHENIRLHRYENRAENLRRGRAIEARHRESFSHNHGARPAPHGRPPEKKH